MQIEIWMKIASVAATAIGALIFFILKSVGESIKSLEESIKKISEKIDNVDRRLAKTEGELEYQRGILQTLMSFLLGNKTGTEK